MPEKSTYFFPKLVTGLLMNPLLTSDKTRYVQTLIMVRHGETEGQSSIRYYGRTDLALSDLGRAQMLAARDALQRRQMRPDLRHGITHVFASPLRRALDGARLIAGGDAPIAIIEEFIEVDFGLFEGLTAEEIQQRYPGEFERWNRDRLAADYTYPGGESRSEFTARVERGVDRMLELWDARATRKPDPRCWWRIAESSARSPAGWQAPNP